MSSITEFIKFIATFSAEEKQEIHDLLKSSEVKVAKVAKVKAVKPIKPILPIGDGEIPLASSYRISIDAVDPTFCMARSLKDGEDKRWKPVVYREKQCTSVPTDGSNMCAACLDRHAKFIETTKPKHWNGLITAEPPGWSHMLGTDWAIAKPPTFVGVQAPKTSDDSASASTSTSSEVEAAEAPKPAPKPKVARAKKVVAAAAAAPTVEVKKTQPAPEPEVVTLAHLMIDGEFRLVHKLNGNVYEIDESDSNKAAKYIGRKVGDDSLDTEAPEIFDEESDSSSV